MSYELRTILLVEDNPDDARLSQLALRKTGLINEVHLVADGEEAMAYLSGTGRYADQANHPQPMLVLLDLKLPRRSGFEVLTWVRQQEGLKRLPVVIFTSSRELSDLNRAYDLGCNSYLVKPSSFSSLQEMMKMLVQYWLGLNETPETTRTQRGDQ